MLSLPFHDKGPPSHISSSINNNISRGSSPDLVSRTVTSLPTYNNASFRKKSKSGSNGGSGGFIMENPAAKGMSSMAQKEKQGKLRKEPSESTLPDFHAYDNPALVPSPVHIHI